MRTRSPEETEAVGERLARDLVPGDVVLVRGELGSGKTTLIRGACRGLDVTDRVMSPTFTVGRRYRGRIPVSHLDLYRIEDLGAEEPGLIDEYLTPDAIAFIEWPPAGGDLDPQRVTHRVELIHAGRDERDVVVTAREERG